MARRPRAGLDLRARREVIATYERSLRRHGPTVRALKWSDEAGQQERFRLIAEVGPWAEATVADVGCGLGDLFGFLAAQGHHVRYVGYDLSPRMVVAARAKYADPRARFQVRDILAEGLGGRFDYVVASGTFNLRLPDHDRYLQRMLAVMYRGCRRAVAFNILHPHRDRRWESLVSRVGYYSVPRQAIRRWCRRLSPRVEVHSGATGRESTLYVRRPGLRGPLLTSQ